MSFAATWMDLEIIKLSDISQEEKDKYITCMWSLKKKNKNHYKWSYLQNRNRPTGTENKCMVTKEKKDGRDQLGVWD